MKPIKERALENKIWEDLRLNILFSMKIYNTYIHVKRINKIGDLEGLGYWALFNGKNDEDKIIHTVPTYLPFRYKSKSLLLEDA